MKESQHVEWKESWRDDHLRLVCGFANAEGGMLVIGRSDKGQGSAFPTPRDFWKSCPTRSATCSVSWSKSICAAKAAGITLKW
ncbi:MAG: AlbA family DNA-binding domain-containing protein [Candidatus Geothermincolia bacterium]